MHLLKNNIKKAGGYICPNRIAYRSKAASSRNKGFVDDMCTYEEERVNFVKGAPQYVKGIYMRDLVRATTSQVGGVWGLVITYIQTY